MRVSPFRMICRFRWQRDGVADGRTPGHSLGAGRAFWMGLYDAGRTFGSQAALSGSFETGLGPAALRPRLSAGLPLSSSDWVGQMFSLWRTTRRSLPAGMRVCGWPLRFRYNGAWITTACSKNSSALSSWSSWTCFSPKSARTSTGRCAVVSLDKEVFTDVTLGGRHEVDLLMRAKFRGEEAFFLDPRREPVHAPARLPQAHVPLLRPADREVRPARLPGGRLLLRRARPPGTGPLHGGVSGGDCATIQVPGHPAQPSALAAVRAAGEPGCHRR